MAVLQKKLPRQVNQYFAGMPLPVIIPVDHNGFETEADPLKLFKGFRAVKRSHFNATSINTTAPRQGLYIQGRIGFQRLNPSFCTQFFYIYTHFPLSFLNSYA